MSFKSTKSQPPILILWSFTATYFMLLSKIQKYVTALDEVRWWVSVLVAVGDVEKRLLFSAALWAQMSLSVSAESLGWTGCLKLNTKPKIQLLRIRCVQWVGIVIVVVVSGDAEWSAVSPGSDLIGWLSGGVTSAWDLIGCVSGRMSSAARWIDGLTHLLFNQLSCLLSFSWVDH